MQRPVDISLVFARLTRYYGLTHEDQLRMPYKAWLAYNRNLPQLLNLEQLQELQTIHAANPRRVARRLTASLGLTPTMTSRELDAQLLMMARDERFKDTVEFVPPKKREKPKRRRKKRKK